MGPVQVIARTLGTNLIRVCAIALSNSALRTQGDELRQKGLVVSVPVARKCHNPLGHCAEHWTGGGRDPTAT
jgi:hypothetical protein